MFHRFATVALSFAVACSACGQSTYKGGTCILAAWTESTAVVTADTKLVSSRAEEPDALGDETSEQLPFAKMHTFGGSLLVTIDGIGSISHVTPYPVARMIVDWDGLSEAARIFSAIQGTPSELDITPGMQEWVDAFQQLLSTATVKPPLPGQGKDLVTLQIFARTRDTGFGGFIARFGNREGRIAVTTFGKMRHALHGETRFVPFGLCASYLGSDASRSELTDKERSTYESLRKRMDLAKTSHDMIDDELEFQRLAVSISRRLATATKPQRIDAPFDVGVLDPTGLWTVTRVLK